MNKRAAVNLLKTVTSTLRGSQWLSSETVTSTKDDSEIRPVHEIPGPTSILGTSLYKYLPGGECYKMKNLVNIAEKRHAKYGPIVRQEIFPGYFLTSLSDLDDFAIICHSVGTFPTRPAFDFDQMYKKSRGRPESLLTRQGEEWLKVRKDFQKLFLRFDNITPFIAEHEKLTEDFVKRIRKIKDARSGEVPDLEKEIAKWVLESLALVCFDRRIGALEDKPSDNFTRLLEASLKLQLIMEKLYNGPKLYRYIPTPMYRQYCKVMDAIWKSTCQFFEETKQTNSKEGFYMKMVDSTGEALAMELATDALGGGTEMTSMSLGFMMYLLSCNPEVQEKLHTEIQEQSHADGKITENSLSHMKYLKAVVKESFRFIIYPFPWQQRGNEQLWLRTIIINGRNNSYSLANNAIYLNIL